MDVNTRKAYLDSGVGPFFRCLRIKYGWSRRYVAAYLGLNSASSVQAFESGRSSLSLKHIVRFCCMSPDNIGVPDFFIMFENNTTDPPCRCPCHYNPIDDALIDQLLLDGQCRLCSHSLGEGVVKRGFWFKL